MSEAKSEFMDELYLRHMTHAGAPVVPYRHDDCANKECRRRRADFPMAFRSDPYCSDNCRKALGLDLEK